MFFEKTYIARGLQLGNKPDNLAYLEFGGPRSITVSLRPPNEEERQHTHWSGSAFCTARGECEPEQEVRAMFEALADRRLPTGSTLPDPHLGVLDADGRINEKHTLPLSCLPQKFKDFSAEIFGEMERLLTETVKVLRWRAGETGPNDPFSSKPEQWSFDGREWRLMPIDGYLVALHTPYIRDPASFAAEVVTLIEKGISEPLHHELWREAWEMHQGHPRSAIVFGVSAVEVGVKTYIGKVVPDAEWLMENLPSPDLDKIVRNYFPTLHQKYGGGAFPPELWKTIRIAIETRNKIVHVGRLPSGWEKHEKLLTDKNELINFLWAARDFLYVLDVHCGYTWALDNLKRCRVGKPQS